MNNYCAEPQAPPDRCGCDPDAFQLARHSGRLVEQQRERIAALEAECERLRQSMTGIVVRHFAQNLDRARRDYELEQYLSDGIAQLEAERDCLKSERDYLGRQLDRLIDQTTPLRPDATNPRWAERIKLDDVIAERDALRAELAAIKGQDVRGDARGKQCPHCSGPMVSLSSMSLRICADCRRSLDWHLEPGQQPLLANNRICSKQDEHNKEQADGHDN